MLVRVIKNSVLYNDKYCTAEDGVIEMDDEVATSYINGSGWIEEVKVEPVVEPEPEPELPVVNDDVSLDEIGLDDSIVEKIRENGIETVDHLSELNLDQLVALNGIGQVTAEKILAVFEE